MGTIEGSNALFQSSIPEVKSPLYLESYISQADEITDDEEIIDINADVLRVLRIQCMLCIDEAGDPATLLYFGHGMERERRLTRGLRSIDFDDSSLRVAAGTERDIQGKGSGRYGFDI